MSNPNDVYAVEFLDILESMGLMQHVDGILMSKVTLSIWSLHASLNILFYYIVDSKILKIHSEIFSISSLVKISIT